MGVEQTKVYYRGIRTAPQKGYLFLQFNVKAAFIFIQRLFKKRALETVIYMLYLLQPLTLYFQLRCSIKLSSFLARLTSSI